MPRLLMMEGNTAEKRARGAALKVRSSSEIYLLAVKAHFPELEVDVVNAADPAPVGAIPHGRMLADYDGIIITGSSLHAYDPEFAVTNQIAMVKEAGALGKPMFGSCWGLQIAVMAAGGRVEYSAKGREVGIARKITLNEAGRAHPMFRAKPPVFDATCIHYDEVTRMPEGATLLASNAHSKVQAAVVPLGKSDVWAVQYHPEFDLAQLVQLYTLYADDMIAQGFFADTAALEAYVKTLSALVAKP
ncbi:MAG: type 1 glutamine amidotransferase, partial [Alphaproteobacteria bacterium]|nr:type 1 glutamine amidotransferase [Alphaproteobacteria bacterium]